VTLLQLPSVGAHPVGAQRSWVIAPLTDFVLVVFRQPEMLGGVRGGASGLLERIQRLSSRRAPREVPAGCHKGAEQQQSNGFVLHLVAPGEGEK